MQKMGKWAAEDDELCGALCKKMLFHSKIARTEAFFVKGFGMKLYRLFLNALKFSNFREISILGYKCTPRKLSRVNPPSCVIMPFSYHSKRLDIKFLALGRVGI